MTARVARALAAGWLLLAIEFFVVMVSARRELTTLWEAQNGLLWLAPTALFASAALSGLGAVALRLLVGSAKRREERWFLAIGAGSFAALVGFGVGGGRHLASPAARLGFACFTGVLGGVLVFGACRPIARLLRSKPRELGVVLVGFVVLVELVNRFVLVRLYPAFHGGLSVLALATAPLIVECWLGRQASPRAARRFASLPAIAVLAAAGLALVPAAQRLARFDNFRLILLEHAPLLGQAVTLAARVAPPAPEDSIDCDAIPPGEREGACARATPTVGRTLDLRGRDLLLISVDALRADHVGAYGYARATTPHIDQLAQNAVLFERAYAPTPHTSYSVTSLMTGKYMRPLLLQDAARDSDTWASLLRTYGYRTAAFYPPAVFFIDPDRFSSFRDSFLGFEYRWVEFAEGEKRVAQVRDYLAAAPKDKRLFVWVHLFAPHEPYEAHPEYPFGERDIDRYDSEIRAADESVGAIVSLFRVGHPSAAVIVTADHGEEFGDHGGRYHGTSVYEEQVRVPLVIAAPGALSARRIAEPVQTIDLLPTFLDALDIPTPPRIRGRDLGALLSQKRAEQAGLALAETEEQTLLADGSSRLICARKLGACKLFDLAADPGEEHDISAQRASDFDALRVRLRELGASHGRYEQSGLRAEGKGWPPAILRGISGDGDAAEDLAGLLDDADLAIRRKAAELLFELNRPEAKAALRLAAARDEDETVRRYAALSLTRLGEGAPLTFELERSGDVHFRRLAALVLAETGDARGEKTLIAWWQDARSRDFKRSQEIAAALGNIRSKDAVWPLVQSLDDVRLRPIIAQALAHIGGEVGQGSLLKALAEEPLQSTRVALVNALVDLGTGELLAPPLTRFLGVPDPLPGGLEAATRAKILLRVGGPEGDDLARLRKQSALGVALMLTIPLGGNGHGVRALVRARASGPAAGQILIGALPPGNEHSHALPVVDEAHALRLEVPPSAEPRLVFGNLPASLGARPGLRGRFVVFADRSVTLDALALVPLADELPPPPPKPWQASGGDAAGNE
ncbi:MAG TPA: sulfatase-like hydrolase/transferase [Polyangiaceae bacterium]